MKSIFQHIDEICVEFPDRWAFRSSEGGLKYHDLKIESDKIAAYLAEQHPGPIIIFGHKSPQIISCMIGVGKSGRAYIPVDTSFPDSRIQDIILNAHPALILDCQEERTLKFDIPAVKPASIEDVNYSTEPKWVTGNSDLYIIYTSGSSGKPKGIAISHNNLAAFVTWSMQSFVLEKNLTFLNQAPFSFDLSVMELYSSLTTGGTLEAISKKEITSPKHLFQLLNEDKIDFWVSTPSFVDFCLKEKSFNGTHLKNLRTFWFCGEILKKSTAAALLQNFPNAKVFNTYGPTEATVAVTSIEVTSEILDKYEVLPIGKTNGNATISLIKSEKSDLTEIVISGPQVSLGYVAAPELTAKSFGQSEYGHSYKTGDAGYIEDDMLFFNGRIDLQVKINGYRIEIGEIETKLLAIKDVKQAVVMPFTIGSSQALFAVIQTSANESDLVQSIRKELQGQLPEYMIPKRFIFTEHIPLTDNGKVDRKYAAGLFET